MTLLAWLGCGLLTAFVLCVEAWAVWIAGIFEVHEQRLRAHGTQRISSAPLAAKPEPADDTVSYYRVKPGEPEIMTDAIRREISERTRAVNEQRYQRSQAAQRNRTRAKNG